MEVTINLPDGVFAHLSSVARSAQRPVDEVIAEKLERDLAIDTEHLEKQIALCSDGEVRQLSEIGMSPRKDARLRRLLQNQNERELNETERGELWNLMETNRLATLKKAFARREMSRRDLTGEERKSSKTRFAARREKALCYNRYWREARI
ncbi:MAG: hypothetical protein JSS81_28985 [Acidobacteria bacterium]|nr:hypothetical protein [Acidobacteriota bacterium]